MIRRIRRILVNLGILDFKVGDKVILDPKRFQNHERIMQGRDYTTIRYYDGWVVMTDLCDKTFFKVHIKMY